MGNKGAEQQFLQFAEEKKHPEPDLLWQSEANEVKPVSAVHYCECGPWFWTSANAYCAQSTKSHTS